MYFFDTYAIIEILKGSKNYLAFKDAQINTTRLNIMEAYYWLLANFGKKDADKFFDSNIELAIEIDNDLIKSATVFRFENKSRELSYVDCIGYIFSRMNGLKFLTGDRQFEHMENVEFVK